MSEVEAKAREGETLLPRVGDTWVWEPLHPVACETVTVTEVRWNGDEWMIESEGTRNGRAWVSASRWIEATVLVRPAGE